ncbi:cytochrome c class I NirC [Candidatus Endoriftia persephone str. Guaymas]|jgi:cytochrome c55X|uniref:Cytochrome c55X NirC n=4 Tax=Gammaproteobacteria TaxID=1236 RepID=G2FJG7_9GAMM|nr:cytochrome c [Candidatus Endoriftia persephone]MBA1332648.1 cytochrome c class I NirC [Candidatus Endoriftia persephone str. Guaymas]EGV50665.1 cytochrome c55X precursor NirC [endosymbiont of Riftia pachyptila (vent Ph05)]EGW53069.1 cytochrome c55X precursor NirC [endosymbiont of Tevnia jerichonana (vent Tica)]KRT53917.1 Cytochrome C oxidase, cbb3-type, subunit III [endosymbiont of Ridgeia piscesae]KRT57700.1 cytochrome c55X [endosymbiont of Ridgeia piscesae]
MKRHLLPLSTLIITLLMSGAALAEISSQRQAEILYLLRHDCGSCHGMRLEGGLGPALTPRRLQQWPVEQLAVTILHGRPGTPMPPWRPFFTDSEALWLATQLKQGGRRP